MRYAINCVVTGGRHGTREAFLKSWGEVMYFATYDEALAKRTH